MFFKITCHYTYHLRGKYPRFDEKINNITIIH